MILISIFIHEFGHLVFGLLSGYKFLYIEILGFTLEKIPGNNNGFRIKYYKKTAPGQCMMFTDNENANPIFFISGGVIFNLLFGFINVFSSFVLDNFIFKIIVIIFGLINILFFCINTFWGSGTSDGITLKEILECRNNRVYYNRIMKIALFLKIGFSYIDMPSSYFKLPKDENRTVYGLEEEMRMHSIRYFTETGLLKWCKGENGEPVDSIIEKSLSKYRAYGMKHEEIFKSIISLSDKELYPGEVLSAARITMNIIKGD